MPKIGVSRLLDVGCGTAELSENLFNRGFNVIALDLGFDSIKRAFLKLRKKNLNFSFIQGDIYRLPYEDSSFDAVVASEILEHLEKPQDALKEVARIVRPGGYFIVSTPYCEHLRFTLCIHCNKKTPINAHLHSFDDKIMENVLKKAGFSIEKKIKYGSKHGGNLGIPGFTFFLPYVVWRFIDAFLCSFLGKQSFMVIRAKRLTKYE